MKLSDIVILEADEVEKLEGDKKFELKEVTKYFPNTFKKAVAALARQGRLTFGGQQVYVKGGDHGPALDQAIAEAEDAMKKAEFPVHIQLNGYVADIDDGGEISYDEKGVQAEYVYVGYAQQGDKLIIGFDCWLNEEQFNEEFDEPFEKTFGEDFDMDNKTHEKIFNDARKQWQELAFCGQAVEVDDKFNSNIDEQPAEDGFFKGLLPRLKSRRVFAFDAS